MNLYNESKSRNRFLRRLAGTALAYGLVAAATVHAEDSAFRPLFNGEDLTGWQGDARVWRVEDGVIVGSTHDAPIRANTFLVSTDTYSDFDLSIEVNLTNHNSGVQFRSELLPKFAMRGYQADVAEATYFGMLYEEKGRGFLPYWGKLSEERRAEIHHLARQGEWNRYEIECRGDRIVIRLNGEVTCDIRDPNGARSGKIGLQLHTGPPMEVRFRNIELRVLPDAQDDQDSGANGKP